jgi:glycosyltransferase involved in cell wall biosynthesis
MNAGILNAKNPREKTASATAVCIIVENLSVPLDRRVWNEALTLRDACYSVSVICPKSKAPYAASYEIYEGIHIYRYPSWEATTAAGYLLEYSLAFFCQLALMLRVFIRTRFKILQGCNPPDNIFLLALLLRPFGVRFIFDHHDLSPELLKDKFQPAHPLLSALVRLAEKYTFQTAHVSIATNQSYKEVAIERGKKSADKVFIVRNLPDLKRLPLPPARAESASKKQLQVLYVGFMGSQDGLDLLLQSIEYIVQVKKRQDVNFLLVGSGNVLPGLKSVVAQKNLAAFVTFTGQVPHEQVVQYLLSADIGVAPDPKSSLNDKSTMIKILEYMAFQIPVVLFDLCEGRRSAGPAALYARPNDPIDFADQILRLLDSQELREQLGAHGRQRIEESLNWETEKSSLLSAYHTALQI